MSFARRYDFGLAVTDLFHQIENPYQQDRIRVTTYPDRPGQLFLEVAGTRHWIRSQGLFERCGLGDWEIHAGNKSQIPLDGPELVSARQVLALKYLSGTGVELGPLNNPSLLPPDTTAVYCDAYSTSELARQYPGIENLTSVDLVDDGEHLTRLQDESVDFILGNHFLECTENLLGTLRSHLCKLRPYGILLYSISDKRRTFDRWRPTTEFEHLVSDDLHGPEVSRWGHFLEHARLVDGLLQKEEIEAHARQLMSNQHRIHFHVWDPKSFHSMLYLSRAYLGESFHILEILDDDTEMVAALQKAGGR